MNKIMKEILADVKQYLACQEGMEAELPKILQRRWKREYGWHEPCFSPEVRRACLRGEMKTNRVGEDIYSLMALWYETITGARPPASFEVDRRWKKELRQGGQEYHLTEKEIDQLIRAVAAGTRRKQEDRDPIMVLQCLQDSESGN